jgi:EmrB/QacA subfamily drug resistance transporter
MAALPFVSGDMLRRGTNRLVGKLGKSSLVNAMAPRRIEIDRTHMRQAFDQAWHRDKHCCFWHLAQPREPALTGFRTMLCQCIELLRERGMAACEARSDMQEDKHQGRFGGASAWPRRSPDQPGVQRQDRSRTRSIHGVHVPKSYPPTSATEQLDNLVISQTERKPLSRRERRVVLAGIMLALTLAALDQNIVATALPRIVSDLGGLAHLSWVVTAFMVASTTTTPLYGKFSDIYGRKPAFLVSIVVFLLGSVLCGMAQGMTQLIVFRAIQGLGAGGLITLAQTTIGDIVTPRERGRYQGLFASVFAGCSVAGPLLGGFITDALSWRWIFYVNLPVGAVALTMIAAGLPANRRAITHRIDYAGALLLIAATSCVLLVLSWGGSLYPWSSTPMLVLVSAAVLLCTALALAEAWALEPVLPLHLFANRVFVLGVAVISFSAMALFAAVVFLPLFFQLVIGTSPTRAGLMISPMMGGVIIASVIGGRLVSRTGRYKLFPVCGLAVATMAYLAMGWAAAHGTAVGWIEAVLVAMGLGIGFVMPNLTTAIQNAVAWHDLGAATSASAFLRSLGGALGVALSGAILVAQLRRAPSAGTESMEALDRIAHLPPAEHAALVGAYAHALSSTFLVGAAIAGCAFVLVLFLPERPLRGSHAEPVPALQPAPATAQDRRPTRNNHNA